MWHKIKITVRDPSVFHSVQLSKFAQDSQARARAHLLSDFLCRVSVARRRPDLAPLCPKTESLTIGSRQRTAWFRRALINSLFTQSHYWDQMWHKIEISVRNTSVSNQGQRSKFIQTPQKRVQVHCLSVFFPAETPSVDRDSTESPSARRQRAWQPEPGIRPRCTQTSSNELSIYPVPPLRWDATRDYCGERERLPFGSIVKICPAPAGAGLRIFIVCFSPVESLSLDGALAESASAWRQTAWQSESGSGRPYSDELWYTLHISTDPVMEAFDQTKVNIPFQ